MDFILLLHIECDKCLLQAARDTSDAPSLLCFEGGKAAAAARSARPLDLMIIANRVDAGGQTTLFSFAKRCLD